MFLVSFIPFRNILFYDYTWRFDVYLVFFTSLCIWSLFSGTLINSSRSCYWPWFYLRSPLGGLLGWCQSFAVIKNVAESIFSCTSLWAVMLLSSSRSEARGSVHLGSVDEHQRMNLLTFLCKKKKSGFGRQRSMVSITLQMTSPQSSPRPWTSLCPPPPLSCPGGHFLSHQHSFGYRTVVKSESIHSFTN